MQRKYFQLFHSGSVQRYRTVYIHLFLSEKPGTVVSLLETETNCKNLNSGYCLGRKRYEFYSKMQRGYCQKYQHFQNGA